MEEHNDIAEAVLRKIRARELTMRPRLYFLLRLLALAALAFLVLAISIFILNFILFSIRLNNHDALFNFGIRGALEFLEYFPWALFALDIVLAVLLARLVRQFQFGYRHAALSVLLGLVAFIALAAVAVDRGTDVNDRLYARADQDDLVAPLGDVYRHAWRLPAPDSGFCRCRVVAVSGNTLTVRDARGTSTLSVVLPAGDADATSSGLHPGDLIWVAGDWDNGVIEAFGIRKLQPGVEVLHQSLILVK